MAFTLTRAQKMVNLDDPILSMIDMGLDLTGSFNSEYQLAQYDFTIGVAAYATMANKTQIAIKLEEFFNF
jgi:hypothetical protein